MLLQMLLLALSTSNLRKKIKLINPPGKPDGLIIYRQAGYSNSNDAEFFVVESPPMKTWNSPGSAPYFIS